MVATGRWKVGEVGVEAAGIIGVQINLTLSMKHGPASGKLAEGVAEWSLHQRASFDLTSMGIYFREDGGGNIH